MPLPIWRDSSVAARACLSWERVAAGMQPHENGVIVRSKSELERAGGALSQAAIPHVLLDEHMQSASGKATACTTHLAKGLEFRAVAVMACDDEVIPSQARRK